MLSSIRRALTPNPSHAEDNNTSALTLDTSPPAPNLLVHDSSPPPFSPIQVSPEDIPPWTNQALNGDRPVTAGQQVLPMDISPDQNSPNREHGKTGHDLLGSLVVNDASSKPDHRSFILDGASDDHLQPPLEGAHASGSPLPSVEPTQTTGNSHRTQRTPTPGKNHPGVNSRVSSPRKTSKTQTETPHPRRSPLPSTAPVQSTNEAQPTQQFPIQNGIYAGLEPGLSNILDSSKMATKKNRQTALHPTVAEQHPTMSEVPDVQPQQNAPANDDANTSTSNAQPLKRKLEEDSANSETKSTKKQRNQPKKEEASTSTVKPRGTVEPKSSTEKRKPKKDESSTVSVEQQDAIEDEAPKKRGKQKEEQGPTESIKPKDTPKDEMPKKRGRPKKEEGSTLRVKSQRVSKEDTPAKRGRPKREIAPQKTATEDPTEQNRVATEIPKKRGRSAKEAEPVQDAEPASVSTAEKPKKRGRPKKNPTEPEEVAETQVASTANTPRKKGRAKKNEVIPEDTEPQGPSNVETTKKRGRSKATGHDETVKKSTPGKRGRPKKK